MNNSPVNFNSVRQPAPSVQLGAEAVSERKIITPNVGIVCPPTISRTPLGDTLSIKKAENPRTAYKLTGKSTKGFKLQNVFSLIIAGCSIGVLLDLIKKK